MLPNQKNKHGDDDGDNDDEVCVRFGDSFSGFATRRVRRRQLPIACTQDVVGMVPPLEQRLSETFGQRLTFSPYHCALGGRELCG